MDQLLPLRPLLPIGFGAALLAMLAFGVERALGDTDVLGDDWVMIGDTDTDTDMLDTDLLDTDTGEEVTDTDTDVEDTAEPSAAEGAGELGGFHCSAAGTPMAGAWLAVLVLGLLRRRRG